MPDKIQINMLGRFEVIVNNERIDQKPSKAKKGWTLIKFLILHIGHSVPCYSIYDVLWPNEASSNPESALKTLVSRMRSFLNQCSEGLGECILTHHGSYAWNDKIPCSIDSLEFEMLCKQILSDTSYSPETRANMDRVLSLYVGDLLPTNAQESWAITKSVSLHNLYIKTIYHYLDCLKENSGDPEEVIRVCRIALEIEAFDERLHLELMEALVKTKRNNEALLQYKYATNLHFKYLGTQPPEGIQEFYKQIVYAGQVLDMDIDSIREELINYEDSRGAFVCEYSVFKEIYNLQMRSLERMGTSMFIALIMVTSVDRQPMELLKLDEIMQNLLDVLVKGLRTGDTITHYNASQYALLLPSVTYETGKMVMERIKRAFYRIYPNSSVLCNYRIGAINEKSYKG